MQYKLSIKWAISNIIGVKRTRLTQNKNTPKRIDMTQ